jgi:hypothetical protein
MYSLQNHSFSFDQTIIYHTTSNPTTITSETVLNDLQNTLPINQTSTVLERIANFTKTINASLTYTPGATPPFLDTDFTNNCIVNYNIPSNANYTNPLNLYLSIMSTDTSICFKANTFTQIINFSIQYVYITDIEIINLPQNITFFNNIMSHTDPLITDDNKGNPINKVQYSILPALPTTLNLNTTTGVISGTPVELMSPTKYTITATYEFGTNTFTTSSTTMLSIIDEPTFISISSYPPPDN